ncbi:MAG TPA: 50S ribosomal protein L24e [Methanomassiliicoccales archaeon]|nr:50S ribosomal protein L24e [Methanomassiliicoccales archaeon]
MVEQHLCSFCGEQIEPGTGKMYVRKDGTTLLFCTNKCYKNMVELKRVPRNVTWTKAYATKKGITMAAKEKSEAKVEETVEAPAEVKAEKKAEPKVKALSRKKARAAKKAEAEAAKE